MRYVLSFCAALLAVELAEGSDVVLSLATQAFFILAALGFNVCGGLLYPSGACIFFLTVLTLGLGAVLKACMGEPLQSNLIEPATTILAYTAGMASILVAAYFSKFLRSRRGLLERFDPGVRVQQMAAGCLLIAVGVPLILPENFKGTFAQFSSNFAVFAIILPVYRQVRQTDGWKSFTLVAFIGWAYLTIYYGIVLYSKQGLFSPSLAWGIAAFAGGYRISFRKFLTVAAAAGIAVTFLTPYSQLARNNRGQPNEGAMALELLEHPLQTRELYNDSLKQNYALAIDYHWFNDPQGLLDRLNSVAVDDALFYNTDHLRPGSPVVIWGYVLDMVPRYLYPDKPAGLLGNSYGREIGLLSDDDTTTSISFTPFADAYHNAGWLGVTLYLGVLCFVMFLVCDSLAGSIGQVQWALLYVMYFSHFASEGFLSFTTYAISNVAAALVAAAFMLTYVAPVIGGLIVPGGTRRPSHPALRPYNRTSL